MARPGLRHLLSYRLFPCQILTSSNSIRLSRGPVEFSWVNYGTNIRFGVIASRGSLSIENKQARYTNHCINIIYYFEENSVVKESCSDILFMCRISNEQFLEEFNDYYRRLY